MRACLFAVIGGNVAHARRAVSIAMAADYTDTYECFAGRRFRRPSGQKDHSSVRPTQIAALCSISIAVFAINDVRLRADC